jgi:hypothetical protein
VHAAACLSANKRKKCLMRGTPAQSQIFYPFVIATELQSFALAPNSIMTL